jgi:hypothetical protein
MNISVIAAKFHKLADDIDAIVEKNGDHDFPDQALKPLVLNLLADDRAISVLDRGRQSNCAKER